MGRGKRISLVLGSGGARGLAHIGVIRYLEEQGYRIESISGSSMGALIGGIYATGKLETYAEWVCALEKMDILRLLDFSFSNGGMLRGEKVINALRELIGEHMIEELPIAFTAVAADLNRRREVWLKTGSLFDAIRASIAIPTVFTPVNTEGRVLVDGGLVNPVPIAPTIRDNTEICIAVNASAHAEDAIKRLNNNKPEKDNWYRDQISSFIDNLKLFQKNRDDAMDSMEIMTSSIEVMQAMITRFQLAANGPDILVKIPTNISTFYEFHHAEQLIEFGYERARLAMKNPHQV
jgi:NTE family protein